MTINITHREPILCCRYKATTDAFGGLRVDKPSSSSASVSASAVVSDKVRAASAAYAAQLDRAERGGGSVGDSGVGGLVDVPVTNDVQTLRIELLRAKRNLEKIQEAKYIALHPKETVKNIFLGNHYSLEFYRSFSDKKDLLSEAIAIGDGNVIITVSCKTCLITYARHVIKIVVFAFCYVMLLRKYYFYCCRSFYS